MSDNKITQDQLEPNVMEELESGIGDLSTLSTENKGSLVAAVTEIYGKSIIAEAIGEPLSASDSFNKMSNDINDLLNKFKISLLINGISVNNEDDFKSLIDKLSNLTSVDTKKIDIEFVSELPDNGVDGKLYIISSNELNIVFTEQIPSSPEENTVYLTYTTEDNNDAFSYLVCKYGVFISIIGAQQLENNELIDTQMYVYYNSEFIELRNKYRLIEKELDFITSITAGAQPGNYYEDLGDDYFLTHTFSTGTEPIATFSDEGDYFSFNVRARAYHESIHNTYNGSIQGKSGISNSICSVVTDSPIDLTTLSNIKINVNVIENLSTSYNIFIGVMSSNTAAPTGASSFVLYDDIFESTVTKLDVSGISGQHYLGVYIIEKSAKSISMVISSVLIEEE